MALPRASRLVVLLAITTLLAGCGAAPDSSPSPEPSVVSTSPATASPPRPKPSKQRSVFAGKTIGIDPGHNGRNHTDPTFINRRIWNGRAYENCNTTGTATNDGYPEATYNWGVATELRRLLRHAGAKVVMTRHDNDGVGPCVDQRARIINNAHADVAIDIHADGSGPDARGFAILQPVPSGTNDAVVPASRRYAKLLRDSFVKTGMPVSTYLGDHGLTTRNDLAGLNLTTVPQVLIECGNMRNREDAALLTSAEFQRKAARRIMAAMAEFLRAR